MKSLFTGFSAERDPTDNLVVEFRKVIGIQVIALAMAPIVATAGFALTTGSLVVSWQIVGASVVVLCALGIALMFWQRAQSSARITIDRTRSRVLVDSHGGQKELPIHDIEKAELGTSIHIIKRRATTVYRVEFVLRNGERVPASAGYCYATPADREKVLEVLNREFSGRSTMLS